MSKADEFDALRASMRARERSMSREFDAFEASFSPTSGLTSSLLTAPKMNRSLSLNRQNSTGLGQNWGSGDHHRSSVSRDLAGSPLTVVNPSRPLLTSQGRSLTQNDFMGGARPSSSSIGSSSSSALRNMRTSSSSHGDDDIGLGSSRMGSGLGPRQQQQQQYNSLEDRGRSDWRRTSVPERGKDFKSLPRKYNR